MRIRQLTWEDVSPKLNYNDTDTDHHTINRQALNAGSLLRQRSMRLLNRNSRHRNRQYWNPSLIRGDSSVQCPKVACSDLVTLLAIWLLMIALVGLLSVKIRAADLRGTTLPAAAANGPPGVSHALHQCPPSGCPPQGTGSPMPATSIGAGQKAGSVLLFNVYTSSANISQQNTQITIVNTNSAVAALIHLFFIDGATCGIADRYVALTPGQTFTFMISDLDPGITGYLLAVATDEHGCPKDFNYLIGEEYVKFETGHMANLPAFAVAALPGGPPPCNTNAVTVDLAFNNVGYNELPRIIAIGNIAAKAEGNETMLIVNRLGGDLTRSAETLGLLFGVLYNDAEVPASFTYKQATCQQIGILSNSYPRTVPRFEVIIPPGRSGWLKLYSPNDIGLSGVVINASSRGFGQGHNMHVLTTTRSVVYTMPVFSPGR